MSINKKRGLGRGLGDLGFQELLKDLKAPQAHVGMLQGPTLHEEQRLVTDQFRDLPIDKIIPGCYQPRKQMKAEDLQELADSIAAQGVIQPIIVRKQENQYELIAGERRWRAAQLAGLQNIPAIVRSISDEAAMAMGLIENIQRCDLNPIEESIALQRLVDEFQMTHQEVALAIGKSRASVTNLLRLQKLNADVKDLLMENALEMGHARALLAVDDDTQSSLAKQMVMRRLSVREAEQLIRRHQTEKVNTTTRSDPDVARFKDDLSEKLGAKIVVQHTAKGRGKLIIHYNNLDELEGILEHIH